MDMDGGTMTNVETIIAIIAMGIVFMSIGIGTTLIHQSDQRSKHKWHTLELDGYGEVYDCRRDDCKLCTKHSWSLWDADLCMCQRCIRIRKLEKEIFGKQKLTTYQKYRIVEVINAQN